MSRKYGGRDRNVIAACNLLDRRSGAITLPSAPARNGRIILELTSTAFKHHAAIPQAYTCDGHNTSIPLAWHHAPAHALSFALICDDPDASNGDWVHWLVYNIPPQLQSLPEDVDRQAVVEIGGAKVTQGINSWPRIGYGGPCPPSGTHRYFFRLYALDLPPQLPADLTKPKLLEKLQGHILAEAQLMGTYHRRR